MSKFACRCGTIIDLVYSPAPEEFLLVPEINIEQAEAKFSKPQADNRDFFEIIDNGSRSVIVCSSCGRVWIQRIDIPRVYVSYVRESLDES